MKQHSWAFVGFGVLGLSILHSRHARAMQGGSMAVVRKTKLTQEQKLATLLPPFRSKIAVLLSELNDRMGHRAYIANSRRSPEVAAQKAAQGLGIVESMHVLDAAVDLDTPDEGWGYPAFHRDIGIASKKLGLTWGGDWKGKKYDPGHVQALPVRDQERFRAMSIPERIRYLERLYKW